MSRWFCVCSGPQVLTVMDEDDDAAESFSETPTRMQLDHDYDVVNGVGVLVTQENFRYAHLQQDGSTGASPHSRSGFSPPSKFDAIGVAYGEGADATSPTLVPPNHRLLALPANASGTAAAHSPLLAMLEGLVSPRRVWEQLSALAARSRSWSMPQWRDVLMILIFLLGLLGLVLFFLVGHAHTWASLPGRHGVSLFYDLDMCPQTTVLAYEGSQRVAATYAKTSADACVKGNATGTSAIAHASLDVTLRLEDGYVPGAAYLPVAILGQDEYAFITLTIVDAMRRTVYTTVTMQFGPDENYPWSTTKSRANTNEEDENWAEDLLEDFGEDLLEEVSDGIGDLVESIAEDVLDLGGLGTNSTEERAEEQAEAAEEAREEAVEAAEEEEEEELELAEEEGLLEDTNRYRRWKASYVGKAALCALGARSDCDYFLHERMSKQVSVPENYFSVDTPPYYYGRRAVPVGTPMVTATTEHYGVHNTITSKHEKVCQGVQCANISIYHPQEDSDRYQLVPAAALLTPQVVSRWPLQLQIKKAVIYSSSNSTNATRVHPALLTFDQLGFDPEFTAFSDREHELTGDKDFHEKREEPVALILLVLVLLLFLCTTICARAVKGAALSESVGLADDDSPPSSHNSSPFLLRRSCTPVSSSSDPNHVAIPAKRSTPPSILGASPLL